MDGGNDFPEKAIGILRKSLEARIRSAGVKLTVWELGRPLSQILLKEVLYA
jgi:hypothetical protein